MWAWELDIVPSKLGPALFPSEMGVKGAFCTSVQADWVRLSPSAPNSKDWQGRDPNQLGFSQAFNSSQKKRA